MNLIARFTLKEILEIASSQKAIISLILTNLIVGVAILGPALALGPSNPLGEGIVLAGRLATMVINVIAVVFIYRLAKTLRRTAWVYVVAAFFPCISLITLLVVNHHATQTLRDCGVRVGLLGAKREDLENMTRIVTPPPEQG
jgi:hypothetical protein